MPHINEPAVDQQVSSGACPTFFKCCILTAKAGGRSSYADAGYELMRHIDDLGPFDIDPSTWWKRVEALVRLLDEPDERVIDWFKMNLPRCIALVPRRRYAAFVEGVRCRIADGG